MNPSKIAKLDTLIGQYLQLGSAMYGGEAVTQLAHALQCAQLAQSAGDSPALIAACLFHDVGHLLAHTNDKKSENGDDHHEKLAMQHLEDLFGPEVTQPILLHVNAKRYLCSVNDRYWSDLSVASQKSLQVQGGIFSETEALEFASLPFAKDAIKLRQYDDLSKDPHCATPNIQDFKALLENLLLQ